MIVMAKKIFISAGEPSGDLHAANLVTALREHWPDADIQGFGGPRFQAAGGRLLYPLVELAVMWFGRVLLNLHKFIRLLNQAERVFQTDRPDAVVVIDYPGFHWVLARRAKKYGIPVFYFVPPQIWAWAGWRVKKVRDYIDYVLCSLPFEPAWYRARGVDHAVFVGHPYFDELCERKVDPAFVAEQTARGGSIVAILPGSRDQEIHKNLPMMIDAAKKLASELPNVRFVVAALHDEHQKLARGMIAASGFEGSIEVFSGKTAEIVRIADIAWAVSGSVGLELMVEGKPTVVVYKIKPFDLFVARRFIKSKYISLVNLLADDEVFPEYLTSRDVSTEMAGRAFEWLTNAKARKAAIARIEVLRERFAHPGAVRRVAAAIVAAIDPGAPTLAGPHGGDRTRRKNERSGRIAHD
jgi:lipid-A-disaccharide synthase